MATRLTLHIGLMKSGTTFVQRVLASNRDRLRAEGVLFAGPTWGDQVAAVEELMTHGGRQQPPLPVDGAWRRLVAEVDAWPGAAVVSMEFMATLRPFKLELLREAFPTTDVRIVVTARDLGRQIPAMWQESLQNQGVTTWTEFLDLVRDPDHSGPNPGRWFWRSQRVARIARQWMDVFGHDALTLVTVPPPGAGPDVLWTRVAQAANLPADLTLPARSNPSLGLASSLVMARLNRTLAQSPLEESDYLHLVKARLAKAGLAGRAGEPRLGLDEPWVLEKSERMVTALAGLRPRLVGDLDDLRARPVVGVGADEVSEREQLEAAIDGLSFLLHEQARAARGSVGFPG